MVTAVFAKQHQVDHPVPHSVRPVRGGGESPRLRGALDVVLLPADLLVAQLGVARQHVAPELLGGQEADVVGAVVGRRVDRGQRGSGRAGLQDGLHKLAKQRRVSGDVGDVAADEQPGLTVRELVAVLADDVRVPPTHEVAHCPDAPGTSHHRSVCGGARAFPHLLEGCATRFSCPRVERPLLRLAFHTARLGGHAVSIEVLLWPVALNSQVSPESGRRGVCFSSKIPHQSGFADQEVGDGDHPPLPGQGLLVVFEENALDLAVVGLGRRRPSLVLGDVLTGMKTCPRVRLEGLISHLHRVGDPRRGALGF